MNSKKLAYALLPVIALCLVFISFNAGKGEGLRQAKEEREHLQQLNRQSIEKMDVEEGPIYVIGHMSPDSDTVCSAIAYAGLLNQLGHEAIPMVTMGINRETAYILEQAGVEKPEELTDASGKNIFLVDHSEYLQAAPGMEDAHIVGVLDHHGIGNIYTGNQVVYEAKPIGATATIVWLDHLNYGLDIDKKTAYILLGAILSDTTNLTGTTTTEADRQAVTELARIAEVEDIAELYLHLREEALSYEGMSDLDIFFSDYKEYEASGVRYGVGLINALNEEIADDLAARMKAILPEALSQKDVDMIFASVGIREEGLKIDRLVPGNELSESVLKNAFPDYDEEDGTSYIYRSGLGRKTKFVPGMTDYLAAHPHE